MFPSPQPIQHNAPTFLPEPAMSSPCRVATTRILENASTLSSFSIPCTNLFLPPFRVHHPQLPRKCRTHVIPVWLVRNRTLDADKALHDDGTDAGPQRPDVHPRRRQPPPEVRQGRLRAARLGGLCVVEGAVSRGASLVQALNAEHDWGGATGAEGVR